MHVPPGAFDASPQLALTAHVRFGQHGWASTPLLFSQPVVPAGEHAVGTGTPACVNSLSEMHVDATPLEPSGSHSSVDASKPPGQLPPPPPPPVSAGGGEIDSGIVTALLATAVALAINEAGSSIDVQSVLAIAAISKSKLSISAALAMKPTLLVIVPDVRMS
jgi:hypothetical protein